MLHVGKSGQVIRDARGWYFSHLYMDMPMSTMEHIFTQILGHNVENYDRSSNNNPNRQKLKLINSMIPFI